MILMVEPVVPEEPGEVLMSLGPIPRGGIYCSCEVVEPDCS